MTRPERMQHKLLLRRLSRHWTLPTSIRFLDALAPHLRSNDPDARDDAHTMLAAALAGRRPEVRSAVSNLHPEFEDQRAARAGSAPAYNHQLRFHYLRVDDATVLIRATEIDPRDESNPLWGELDAGESWVRGLFAELAELDDDEPAGHLTGIPGLVARLDEAPILAATGHTTPAPECVTAIGAMIDTLTAAPHGPTAAALPAAA